MNKASRLQGITKTTNEEAWVKSAQAGDIAAFRHLYDNYAARIFALCLRLAGNRCLAEEATQEVFIKAWQRLPSFEQKAQFATWLHSLAANVCISYLRRQRSWLKRILPWEYIEEPVLSPPSVHTQEQLEAMIARLPQQARWVFVLSAVEGYRHQEIAQMLNIAEGTSKAQLNRAKQLLKGWMQDE